MKQLESFALCTGNKISEPYVWTEFIPLPYSKYITISTDAPYQSRNFDYFEDTLEILTQVCQKLGIGIIQVGTEKDRKYDGVYRLCGKTNYNQLAYVLKNSLCHVGVDSLNLHLAASQNTPIVGLYCNMLKEQSAPLWGDKDKQILIQADRKGKYPSYSAQEPESEKVINNINPETIAENVCKLLGVHLNYPYKTLWNGPFYKNKFIEMRPDSCCNVQNLNIDSLIARMDYEHNEKILDEQFKLTKCSIVCDKPVSLDLIKKNKKQITEIVFVVKEGSKPDFINDVHELGVNYQLITFLPDDKLKGKKLDFFDFGLINNHVVDIPEEIKNEPNLYYKSSKWLLSQGKIYPSYTAWKNGQSIENFVKTVSPAFHDDEDFWKEARHFQLLKKEK